MSISSTCSVWVSVSRASLSDGAVLAGCVLTSCISVREPLVTLRALGAKRLSFISLTGVPLAGVVSTVCALGQRTTLLTRTCREQSELGAACLRVPGSSATCGSPLCPSNVAGAELLQQSPQRWQQDPGIWLSSQCCSEG